MTHHVLDRPIWDALANHLIHASHGTDRARRFMIDISPLAAARDDEPDSLRALADLVTAHGPLLLLQADAVVLPKELVARTTAEGVQMVCERAPSHSASEPDGVVVERLSERDIPAMRALAELTKPGPFAARTASLGAFYGVKDQSGSLVAMAGERLRHAGYTEVSGVCTHPSARGRGLARLLSTAVTRAIHARGEVAYLHAYASNRAAIALYESLGFRLRCAVHVAEVVAAEVVAAS
ncbi:MAG TPA: GNAT family N-acetyltransferase [Myxococcota bacterium]